MTKGTTSKPTEAERLAADVPAYLQMGSSGDAKFAFSDNEKPADTGENSEEETTPPIPSSASYRPGRTSPPPSPQLPAPTPSAFISTLGTSKGKSPMKSSAQTLGMSDLDLEKLVLISEVFRQSVGSTENERFSVANPDKFDGTKPEKLDTFEAQCRSVYLSNERKYAEPSRQALFAGSYLEGTAFEWWKGELKKSSTDFKASAPLFWDNLRSRFGNPEYGRVVEERLTFLQMKETDHVNRHLTTFENLAAQTSWNEEALRSRLYWSIASRLREELGRCDPASFATLPWLKTRLLQIDHRYWERQDEIRREKGRQGHSDKPAGSKKATSTSTSTSTTTSSSPSPSGPPKTQNKPANSQSSSPPRSNTDASGRITAEERKRRMDNRLCLYCGKEGHGVKNCPVSEAKSKKKAAGNSSKN